ncbi:DUF7002 family protein [Paenibacillus protaetiae]|uniref:DUF4433 domain-containing protein n=1 Tax=Paenibacillus protaetiae TaxID=2509456 RepID=A0A4P6ESI2_9BACL|nr:hypothetical protein [Paenibacillus protaetiae]QAY66080.1 hypothetical protein ET464_06425 [Paenibacillus protaetiae]
MREALVSDITKTIGRKRLYHFTRVSNLPAIAERDGLLSSYEAYPHHPGIRRTSPFTVMLDGKPATLNAHLPIPDSMMEEGTTLAAFRAYLDRHVFLWPTAEACKKMLDMYSRREKGEKFAILELDAYPLLADHYDAVKLSKYDSGSSPRYPHHCKYRKSTNMFVPIDQFKAFRSGPVPVNVSEIKEILIERQIRGLSSYLQAVYTEQAEDVPSRWRKLAKPLTGFAARRQ